MPIIGVVDSFVEWWPGSTAASYFTYKSINIHYHLFLLSSQGVLCVAEISQYENTNPGLY